MLGFLFFARLIGQNSKFVDLKNRKKTKRKLLHQKIVNIKVPFKVYLLLKQKVCFTPRTITIMLTILAFTPAQDMLSYVQYKRLSLNA